MNWRIMIPISTIWRWLRSSEKTIRDKCPTCGSGDRKSWRKIHGNKEETWANCMKCGGIWLMRETIK